MNCLICNYEATKIFNDRILRKYDVSYFYCDNCKFLSTERPFWLKEAYQNSINVSDTGILSRNLSFARLTTLIIYFFFDKNAKYLDYAGGYGIFTRLMRDIGVDYYWDDKFSENLVARGFEFNEKLDKAELITLFEVFEHLEDPIQEIENLLSISRNILFSTDLLPNPVPSPEEWTYYGLSHGQHISFYSYETLKYISEKYNLNLYTNKRNIHLFTTKKINPVFFNLILKLSKTKVFDRVKKKFDSRTLLDSEFLVNSKK